MLIQDLSQLEPARDGRLLAIDHGSKTLGLAISDAGWRLASPLATIRRGKLAEDLAQLLDIIEEREVSALLMGYPMNMDGSSGPRCQSIRAFVRNLEPHCDLPILLWDERLSTAAAKDAMKDAGMRAQKRHQLKDAAAAAIILQSALDKL